jgi:hypothetical protein
MKAKKPKGGSLRERLSQNLLEALAADFQEHGITVLEKMRETHPERYIELAGKLIMTTAEPPSKMDFSTCQSIEEIGIKFLESIGCPRDLITDEMVQQAVEASNKFIAQLEAIKAIGEPIEGGIN